MYDTILCLAKTYKDASTHSFLNIVWPPGHQYRQQNPINYSHYIRQLIQKYGPLPPACSFFTLINGPAPGSYPQLCIAYEEAKQKAFNYAEAIQFGCDKWETISPSPLRIAWRNPDPLPKRLFPYTQPFRA